MPASAAAALVGLGIQSRRPLASASQHPALPRWRPGGRRCAQLIATWRAVTFGSLPASALFLPGPPRRADRRPQATMRREHPVEARQVHPRRRHQRREQHRDDEAGAVLAGVAVDQQPRLRRGVRLRWPAGRCASGRRRASGERKTSTPIHRSMIRGRPLALRGPVDALTGEASRVALAPLRARPWRSHPWLARDGRRTRRRTGRPRAAPARVRRARALDGRTDCRIS